MSDTYAIARIDPQPRVFAGLWEGFKWPDGTVARTFTIVTTYADETVGDLRDRMPVILESEGWSAWLGKIACDRALKPACEDVLKVWPVSKQVNQPNIYRSKLSKGYLAIQPCQPAFLSPIIMCS